MKQKLHDLIDAVIAKNQEGQRLTFGWSVTSGGAYCVTVHDQNRRCEYVGDTVYLTLDLQPMDFGMKIDDLIKEVKEL
jgi:hypothetical protein